MVRLAYFNALRCLNQFREETIALLYNNQIEKPDGGFITFNI